VIIPFGVSLKEIVAQQCYQTTEDFKLAFTPVTPRMLRKYRTEHGAELSSVERMVENYQIQ